MLKDKIIYIFLLFSIISFGQQKSKMLQASIQQASGGGDVPRKMEIVLQSSQVTGTANLTDFPVLITLDMLDTEIVDGGTYSAKSNGDDLYFYSDASLTTRLSVDIVQFTASATAGNRRCTIFVKVPTLSYNSDTSIYVRYNDPSATQPAASGTYGSEDVWSSFTVATTDGYINRVDSATMTAVTSGTTATDSNPFGTADFAMMDFNTNELYYADVTGMTVTGGLTFYSWFEFYTAAQFERLVNLVVDSTNDAQLQFTHEGAVATDRIGIGYETSVGFISTTNTTEADGFAASTWHFAGGSTDATDDIDLFANGTTTTTDGVTGLSGGPTAQQRFYIGGRGDDTSNFDGRGMFWLMEGNIGYDWIETFYNNTSSPATFGVEGTPTDA